MNEAIQGPSRPTRLRYWLQRQSDARLAALAGLPFDRHAPIIRRGDLFDAAYSRMYALITGGLAC